MAELDECELWFSKVFKSFQSGRRERELYREQRQKFTIEIEVESESHRHRQKSKPKTQKQESRRKKPHFKWVSFNTDQERRLKAQQASFAEFRALSQSHPFKTNDKVDEQIFMTHGRKNPRARRNL